MINLNLRVLCSILFLFLITSVSRSPAQVYDYTAVPDSSDTYTTAKFRVYVPDTVSVIRGVYFYVNPYNSDSRYIVNDQPFRELCTGNAFALLGAQLDNLHMDSGIGDAVHSALDTFAVMSTHPEIEFSAMFLEGYSWGGQFSYHFSKWNPQRVLGFVTQKGGYHDTGPAGQAIYVPGYMFIGENDLPYRIENLTGIFEENRPLGALWILAMQPGAGHQRISDRNLLNNYFLTVIERRLPEIIPPDQPLVLQTIEEPSGWLGNRTTFAIGEYACYDQEIRQACWFPSRPVGEQWQVFVSDSTVTDTIPCDTPIIESEENTVRNESFLSQSYPNPCLLSPGNPVIKFDFRVEKKGKIELTIYNPAGQIVSTLLKTDIAAGQYSIDWDGKDAAGRYVASGNYFYRLRIDDRASTGKMILLK
ncbi:MAG: T9SS type A sorting domain-containing protein [Planctomycetes bacterium]|nr:T9SS type A sorting domain-containing protein [Planctomycetota bacterium]